MQNNFISDKDLVALGYKEATAKVIIHQARDLLVSRGFEFYNRKRLMIVPKAIVSEILGVELNG
jgi:conserved hypothetical protein